jgi:large subunit ribosomal protein L10
MKIDEPKNSQNRIKKGNIITEVSEKVNRAKALIFTDYQGLTHLQLEGFKKKLRAVDTDVMIAKNTLLKIALASNKNLDNAKEEIEKNLNNPTATLFAYSDVISPLKELAKTLKELNLPTVKFGILDGKVITAEQVKTLATLPSREMLIAQLLANMQSPIYGLHRALNWNIQSFVMTLGAIAKAKPAAPVQAPASTPAPTPAVPDAANDAAATEEAPSQEAAAEPANTETAAEETKIPDETAKTEEAKESEGGEN